MSVETVESLGGQCVACGVKKNLTIDHIKPSKLGGTARRSNLQVLCLPHNISKGQRTMDLRRLAKPIAKKRCARCAYSWKSVIVPKSCPRCHRYDWNRKAA